MPYNKTLKETPWGVYLSLIIVLMVIAYLWRQGLIRRWLECLQRGDEWRGNNFNVR